MSKLKIGYIGLGKMGFNMVERMLEKGYEIVATDKNEEAVKDIAGKGASGVNSLNDMARELEGQKVFWIMVPYMVVDSVLGDIKPHLVKGDIVVDGGNSPYTDSMRRAKELEELGVKYLDAGVSGGPGGARNGACIMVGGDREAYNRLEGLFKDLTVDNGYGYMGKSGAGHFVKMVHNGIEYGMMQSIAEGFDIVKQSDFNLNMSDVTKVYKHGSVIESKLMDWMDGAFKEYGSELGGVSGSAAATGEGKWTIEAAKKLGIPVKVIEDALAAREYSQDNPGYQGKIISALRNQFGGHAIK